jgi:NADH-quinone oxidoreductase subunit L
MLVLVMGSSYALMFVGWEGVGLCSYLLIGFWFSDREKSDAGKKAFIVNRIGDFGFLVAMFLLFAEFGSLDFTPIFAGADTLVYAGGLVTAITLFFFLGAAGKSAQMPLYVWLPDAMAGPTPVSALIHAATMVTAGVYLVARSSVLFALSPVGSATVAGVGALTALFAATIALKQQDIKKVLAYSTVSQLGYMFVGVGVGAYAAGIFHLMTHAFFKALLFMGSGAVIHAMHHAYHATHSDDDAQDMRNMGGLKARMPITWITMWIATLAIAGIWPFAGFFSKDEIIWQTAAFGGAASAPYPFLYTVLWLVALAAAMLTAYYMTRMMVMTFHGTNRTGAEEEKHLHEAPAVMWVPLAMLAVLSAFGGWINVPEAIRTSFLGFGGALPMGEWLHHWLEPITAQAHEVQLEHLGELSHAAPFGGGEVLWAVLSTVAAAAVVAGAFRLVGAQKIVPAKQDAEPTGFARVLYHKYYVDELYDRFIVQPTVRGSRFCWRVIDAGIIDGTVNAVGWVAKGVGWGVSMFQSGALNTYAFILAVGVLVILGVTVF